VSSDYKYLGIGLVGGIGAAGLLITGMFFLARGTTTNFSDSIPTTTLSHPIFSATQTIPSASPTATDLPTITPYPTIVLTPTATLTKIESMRASGDLIFPGSLSSEQQILLYESSLKYRATTPLDSLEMAKRINGVEYGNPANTCGPLALAIMRDAGLVSPDTIPHDFWLLNPWVEGDRNFLNSTLLPEKYSHFVFHVWLRDFDWRAFPLQPGDFLYIKAGGGGNFDHMLVVTRMDSHLRAYAVTNFQTLEGFVIDEVLLYDPAEPTAGIFASWSERQNASLGSTGYGGFELWRPSAQ
jgi:hypothetical protein